MKDSIDAHLAGNTLESGTSYKEKVPKPANAKTGAGSGDEPQTPRGNETEKHGKFTIK